MADDEELLAENGPPPPERGTKTVRIPVRIANGSLEMAWGAPLPGMSDCSGELVVPASAIRDASDLALLDVNQRIPFLPKGATVLCKLGARHVPKDLLILCKLERLPEPPHQRAAFVEIVLEEDLELRLRGTKPALLGDVACKIPAMQDKQASSLNEAYRRVSEKFEPTRRSAGGNVFLNAFHKPTDDAWLVSLNTLRDERVGVWDAYLRTTFSADTPHGVIEIRPGSSSAALDALLTERRVADWAYVTAYNPGSRLLPEETNQRAHAELCAFVVSKGWTSFEGRGAGLVGDWPPEVSLLILGVSPTEARALGRKFGQLAVVVGLKGSPADLQAC